MVLKEGSQSNQVDVVFDIYQEKSIKNSERSVKGEESGHQFQSKSHFFNAIKKQMGVYFCMLPSCFKDVVPKPGKGSWISPLLVLMYAGLSLACMRTLVQGCDAVSAIAGKGKANALTS